MVIQPSSTVHKVDASPAQSLAVTESRAVEAGTDDPDAGLASDGPDDLEDGVCPPPAPGFEVEAWLSDFSDHVVTDGLQVGDTFVFMNAFFFDVPASGGEGGGIMQVLVGEGTSVRSVGTAFGPTMPGLELAYDESTGDLSGALNINTTADGGPQVTESGEVSGTLHSDGTVTGSIRHSAGDLAFEGTWTEGLFAYSADPDCLGPEYRAGG